MQRVPEVGRSKARVVGMEKGMVGTLGDRAGDSGDQMIKNLLYQVKRVLLKMICMSR